MMAHTVIRRVDGTEYVVSENDLATSKYPPLESVNIFYEGDIR